MNDFISITNAKQIHLSPQTVAHIGAPLSATLKIKFKPFN